MGIVQLHLSEKRDWDSFVNGFIIGYAIYRDEFWSKEMLYDLFLNAIVDNRLSELLKELNGSFAVIITYLEKTYLIVDHIGSYPLLYGSCKDLLLISDSSQYLIQNLSSFSLNNQNIAEFLSLGYISGHETLFDEVNSVDAGSYVVFNKSDVQVVPYYDFIFEKKILDEKKIFQNSYSSLKKNFEIVMSNFIDRQIVIPLSGGYDSRLIACLCKDIGIKNVFCFSYGKKNNWEISVSQKVANMLGFEWSFVEYSDDLWSEMLPSEQFHEYQNFSSNLNAVPHIQDYLAIKILIESGKITKDAVVIPGHSADLLGGSHLPSLKTSFKLPNLIFEKYYNLNELNREYKQKILKKISNEIGSLYINEDMNHYLDSFTDWGIKNRQSKFIVNSVRVYEFFGLSWLIPLWDKEFVKTWLEVPYYSKQNSSLFHKYLFQLYFDRYHVNFTKPEMKHKLLNKYLKLLLKDTVIAKMKQKIFKDNVSANSLFYHPVQYYIFKNDSQKLQKYLSRSRANINGVLGCHLILSKMLNNIKYR